jgi:ribonuclease PH
MTKTSARPDKRKVDQLRPYTFEKDFAAAAKGSVLISMGRTRVLCGVTVDEKVPGWMRAQKVPGGWITSEYSMLPYASSERMRRESSNGKVGGRTHEIQRLIGRSLRAIVDLEKLGPRSLWVDCDVIEADGGTRTASITGAYVALRMAVNRLLEEGLLEEDPVTDSVAAISVGVVDGQPVLDLSYAEDVRAEVDMNVVMTGSGRFIEVQGTAEGAPYTTADLNRMLALAKSGIRELTEAQARVVGA